MTPRYRVGLFVVESELPLSLPAAPLATDPRIVLRAGTPDSGIAIDAPGIGCATLSDDAGAVHVTVSIANSYDDAARGFVQGVVLPAAVQLTGAWHLHASAVVIEGGVVALIGTPGAGKSLLGAAVVTRGHSFYADDGLVIGDADPPRALLGSPHIRLGEAAAGALGVDLAACSRCPTSDKRIIPPSAAGLVVEQGALPVRAMMLVRRGAVPAARFEAVKPSQAALELLAAEFHPTPGQRSPAQERARFETAVDLARRVPMHRIIVPDDLGRLAETADILAAFVRADRP